MGADIHLFAEVQQPDGSCAILEPPRTFEEGTDWEYVALPKAYPGRNYMLFSILAGVRKYPRNFTTPDGVKHQNSYLTPIAFPRGVPDDASPEYKAEVEDWDTDGHDHSYLTLEEVLSYPWTEHKITLSDKVKPKPDARSFGNFENDPEGLAKYLSKLLSEGREFQELCNTWELDLFPFATPPKGAEPTFSFDDWIELTWDSDFLYTTGKEWRDFFAQVVPQDFPRQA